MKKETAKRKAQTIICKCGAIFAACIEPHCYTDREWQRELRKYVNEGCSVKIINCDSFSLEKCTCDKNKITQTSLF